MAQDITERLLTQLQREEPETFKTFMAGICRVVEQSFQHDAQLKGVKAVNKTGDEVRRRTRMCAEVVRDMRLGEVPHSWQRILDELPNALRAKLDGLQHSAERKSGFLWVPPERGSLIIPGL